MMIERRGHICLSSYDNKIDKDGNILCLNCEDIITEKRRYRYCSDECANAFFIKNNHGALKRKLSIERECVCAHCKKTFRFESELILDHIEPIATGGAEFDEENLQLLCHKCNKIKTANDMKNIAVARRIEANDSRGQTNFIRC